MIVRKTERRPARDCCQYDRRHEPARPGSSALGAVHTAPSDSNDRAHRRGQLCGGHRRLTDDEGVPVRPPRRQGFGRQCDRRGLSLCGEISAGARIDAAVGAGQSHGHALRSADAGFCRADPPSRIRWSRSSDGRVRVRRFSRSVQSRSAARLARSGHLGRLFIGRIRRGLDCLLLFAMVLDLGPAAPAGRIFDDG